jgi:hypothetical protein
MPPLLSRKTMFSMTPSKLLCLFTLSAAILLTFVAGYAACTGAGWNFLRYGKVTVLLFALSYLAARWDEQ